MTSSVPFSASSETKISINTDLREPPMYQLIFLNDTSTTYEFVVDTLVKHLNYKEATAQKITEEIHEVGSACVAVLPYELAEQKGIEITVSARSHGYPLNIKIEPEAD